MTDRGSVRELNEDCGRLVIFGSDDPAAPQSVLAVVADGMGGHQSGEIASSLAIDVICRLFDAGCSNPGESLKQALLEANRAILALSTEQERFEGMGTTCTALAVCGDYAYLAHAGDTRLYLIRGGALYQMTEDHTAVMEMARNGLLTLDEARRHPDRNVLRRALGRDAKVEVDVWNEPFPVRTGDRFILCSDGLDAVSDDCIRDTVLACEPADACRALIRAAWESNAQDNVTAGVIHIEADDAGRNEALRETREAPRETREAEVAL